MKKNLLACFICLASVASAFSCGGSDSLQQSVRENPAIDTTNAVVVHIPGYINLKANHIDLKGNDWSALQRRLESAKDSVVNLLFIGDSHLQADMGSAITRRRMADRFGHAGRGLTVPFRLAGTNQPIDYSIESNANFEGSRLLKKPWPTEMGFTGIGISSNSESISFNICADEAFDSVEVFYSGLMCQEDDTLCAVPHKSPLRISFPQTSSCQTISLLNKEATIHGFNLINGNKGILTHVIGNNGATFATYNALPQFATDISQLHPSLIIISMGTNEAFSKISADEMYNTIDQLIKDIRTTNPNAEILLTTPAECQHKIVKRTRKRRRRTVYQVNSKIERMRNVILEYADRNKIPVYDFYAVAGGKGSSSHWLGDALLNKDRIHLTRKGYTLQGTLFTNALADALESGCTTNNSN